MPEISPKFMAACGQIDQRCPTGGSIALATQHRRSALALGVLLCWPLACKPGGSTEGTTTGGGGETASDAAGADSAQDAGPGGDGQDTEDTRDSSNSSTDPGDDSGPTATASDSADDLADSAESDSGASSGDDDDDASGGESSSDGDDSGATGDDDTGDTTGSDECPHDPVDGDPELILEQVASGFRWPIYVGGDPSNPERLFVAQQAGQVKILEPGQSEAPEDNFLEVDTRRSGEMGLLGFAFHPEFPDDPRVYVNYNPGGDRRTRVSEYSLSAGDPSKADPASERVLIEIDQPYANHNGGGIEFGDDGYLYISMGDGGSGGDPDNNGQKTDTLLGGMLRIDVEPSGGKEYTVPDDNPFVGQSGYAPELWAIGLRNVWRFSFDLETGLLYGGDVGQNRYEYVHIIEAGKNYGWRPVEGSHCYPDGSDCSNGAGPNEENNDGYVMPIAEYPHSGGGASITGGIVYRYCEVPGWDGRYFYADYVTNEMFALKWDGSSVDDLGVLKKFQFHAFTSFGSNARGEVFAAVHDTLESSGKIYRLAPKK